MQYLFYLCGFYGLFLLIQYLTVFLRNQKFSLQYPQYLLVSPKEVPPHFQATLDRGISRLKAFGFQQEHYLKTKPLFRLWSSQDWSAVLINKEGTVLVVISIKYFSESVDLLRTDFYSFFDDDTTLVTINAEKHGVLAESPEIIIEDSYAVDVSQQWSEHQRKLNLLIESKGQPQPLNVNNFLEKIEQSSSRYLEDLAKKEIILRQQDNTFKISWQTNIRLTFNLLQGLKKVNQMLARKRELAKDNSLLLIPILPEIEVEAFERMEQMNSNLVGRKFRSWLLFASLGFFVFIAAVSKWFEGWNLIIFVGAIAFHEFGHAFAMKLFGYRDTSVLFIPFFGALATGSKDNATLNQKFWVSLAGPLPGLIVGIILAFASKGDFSSLLFSASTIFLYLNIFNLLPIYPLDGGQIAELLLFSRLPYLGLFFKLFGVVLLGGLAILSRSPLLLFFAVLIALSIPGTFRSTKINRKLRSQIITEDIRERQDILRLIFQNIQSTLPFNSRYVTAKNLLNRHQDTKARGVVKFSLLIVYVTTLLGGIIISLIAMLPGQLSAMRYLVESPEQTIARVQKEKAQKIADLDRKISEEPDNIEYRLTRARFRLNSGDYQGAIADCDRILALDNTNLKAYRQKAQVLWASQEYPATAEVYDIILSLDPQDIQTLYSRANLMKMTEQPELAIADYSRVIELKPNDLWAYLFRAEIYLELKDYQAVLDDTNLVLQTHPEESYAYDLRSQAKHNLGDLAGAKVDRQKAEDFEY